MRAQHISRKRNVCAKVRGVCLISERLHSEGMEGMKKGRVPRPFCFFALRFALRGERRSMV